MFSAAMIALARSCPLALELGVSDERQASSVIYAQPARRQAAGAFVPSLTISVPCVRGLLNHSSSSFTMSPDQPLPPRLIDGSLGLPIRPRRPSPADPTPA